MDKLFNTPLVHIGLTLLVFMAARQLQIWCKKSPVVNPILISVAFMIGYLKLTNTSYEDYEANTKIISFWLAPSVIALGFALYKFIEEIKSDFKRIIFSMFAGSVTGIISVVLIAYALGASKETMISLSPKSVTTPIALEVSRQLGGIPSLTVAFVIIVGILGALLGHTFLQLIGVRKPKAVGLALGATAHALGTASISEKGPDYGAFSGLGLALNGVITAVLAPTIMSFLIDWLY